MPKDRTYTDAELAEMLHRAGVRPSAQRISIFSFVANSQRHPAAESIFTALSEKYPSLSRTTVYNSLHTLVDAGLIRELEIESGNMRYDLAPQSPHSHFICRVCGRIFDMPMPADVEEFVSAGFATESVDIYFRGLCPECRNANGDMDSKERATDMEINKL